MNLWLGLLLVLPLTRRWVRGLLVRAADLVRLGRRWSLGGNRIEEWPLRYIRDGGGNMSADVS